MWDEGELEIYMVAIGVVVVCYRGSQIITKNERPAPLPDRKTPPGPSRECGTDCSDAESDEEVIPGSNIWRRVRRRR